MLRKVYFEMHYQDSCWTDYNYEIDIALREKERKRVRFASQSPQIDSRKFLLEKIRNVAEKYTLSKVTVHLSVYLLDIFMDNHNITDERLNLVALVSLLIAAKMEEKETNIPKLTELNSLIGNEHPLKDFVSLEKMMLNFLDWDIIIPTSATFCEYFMEVIVNDIDYQQYRKSEVLKAKYPYFHHLREEAENLVFEFLDLCLSDCDLCQDIPSKVAAACLFASRKTMELVPVWPNEICRITRYNRRDIINIMYMLVSMRKSHSENRSSKRKSPESGYLSSEPICMTSKQFQRVRTV